MFAIVKTGTILGCLFLLMRSVFVYSKLAPPCMSQLGLRQNVSPNPLTFHLEVFDGEADNVRLNSPQAWIPLVMNESFLQINISQPVLLTALQVQGDPLLTGRVTGWVLETSLDCDNYHSEKYSIDSERLQDTETVLMHKIEFVTCIRLKPTQYRGQTPALRLELLGCAVYDDSKCCPGVQPAKELWIDDGGCQVNYEQEVVLSWVKVLLQPSTASEDNLTVASSLSCQQWNDLDISNMNRVSVTSADKRSRWVTLEFQTPVRARCLRIFPPKAVTIAEVHTSQCGLRLTSSLVELDAGSRPPSRHNVEDITSVATTDINPRDITTAAPTTTTRETLETQTPGKYSSTTKPNETHNTNSDINNNGSQADLTQYSNGTKNSMSNNGSQASPTQYSNDTISLNFSTNSLLLDTPTLAENFSPTVASTENTITIETFSSTDISSENSFNVTSIGNTSTHETTFNDSLSLNTTAVEEPESTDRNINISESTNTQPAFSDLFTNITITPTVQGRSSDKPPDNESKPQTSTSKVEDITFVTTTDISPRDTTTTAPTTTTRETLETQTPGEYSSTTKPNETHNTNSDSNNNGSQADLTQYSNGTKNSMSNNGSQPSPSEYSTDTTNLNFSTNSLWLDTPTLAENFSTTVASIENTTTIETLSSTNISSENSFNVTSIGNTSTHETTFNNSLSLNTTAVEEPESTDRNINISESTNTQPTFSDLFTNITITPTVQGRSSDKPHANQSEPETSTSTGYNGAECGVKAEAPRMRRKRVIGGHVNSPGEWPWLVSLHYLIEFDFTRRSGFKHACGATLVAPGWVITAAHCFSDDVLEGLSNLTCWRVYLGMHDLAKASSDHFVQERLIDAVYKFPSYNIILEPFLYDLALVKLNEPVAINERSSPICLDDHTDLHDEDSLCYVSGWGKTTQTTPGSRYPHTAAMSTMTLASCKEMYDRLGNDHEIKQYARIEPPVLCAAVGSNGQDSCQGDSGGPLMCERHGRWYQAGIVSGGYQCGHQATPGIYTRISYYSKWIVETMELHND